MNPYRHTSIERVIFYLVPSYFNNSIVNEKKKKWKSYFHSNTLCSYSVEASERRGDAVDRQAARYLLLACALKLIANGQARITEMFGWMHIEVSMFHAVWSFERAYALFHPPARGVKMGIGWDGVAGRGSDMKQSLYNRMLPLYSTVISINSYRRSSVSDLNICIHNDDVVSTRWFRPFVSIIIHYQSLVEQEVQRSSKYRRTLTIFLLKKKKTYRRRL